jgi:hypothetical protein
MDDAWKKAISEGLKRAKRGAGKSIERTGNRVSKSNPKALHKLGWTAGSINGGARGALLGAKIGGKLAMSKNSKATLKDRWKVFKGSVKATSSVGRVAGGMLGADKAMRNKRPFKSLGKKLSSVGKRLQK